MSSKRDSFLLLSIISPKKARMASDDDDDIDADETKRTSLQDDCINVTNLEGNSYNSTIYTVGQNGNEHEVLNDKGKQLIVPTSNNPEINNLCTIINKNDTKDDLTNKQINLIEANESLTHNGKDYFFIDTSKTAQICNEKSVDKMFGNGSPPKKTFQISSDCISSSMKSNEEKLFNPAKKLVSDTKTVIRAGCSFENESSSIVINPQKDKKEINLVDNSGKIILESINFNDDINIFTSDPCNSKSIDMNTSNGTAMHDQEQFQMSFKNQTGELNCISLFTEDETDTIAKLIIDSNLINNEMENFMLPENSNGIGIIENIIRSDEDSESDLDEKENINENSENGILLKNNFVIHNSHGSEILSDNIDNMLDTNEEISLNNAQITDFSPLSTISYENPIPDLVDSRSSSRVESPLGTAGYSSPNIDLDEDHDAGSTDDLLEAELSADESQDSTIETRIVQAQPAKSTIKPPIVNVLRLEILTTKLNESSSDEQYKTQRSIHIIENEAHMIRLQKLLYNPNPPYFEGVDRFNLIQGTIPDIIEVLKAYPDSSHHAHVRIFNPHQESYKNTVSNTYLKNSSGGSLSDCPICMYTLYNPVSTWCGHIFCENCLLHAIEYNRECPSCRKHLSIPYYHKVFM